MIIGTEMSSGFLLSTCTATCIFVNVDDFTILTLTISCDKTGKTMQIVSVYSL